MEGSSRGWEWHREEGNAAAQRGDHSAAEQHYSEALQLNDSVAALWTNRALQRHALQRFEDALSDANRAIETDKHWLKGNKKKAEDAFESEEKVKEKESSQVFFLF